MNRRFFDNLLDSSTRRNKEGKRTLTLPVSIAIHVVILFAVLVLPYLRYNELPEPALGTVRAFFVEPVAAPPPPPPPPAAPKAAVAAPKISRPKPVVQEPPKFTAPIEVPKEIPRDEGVAAAASTVDSAPSAGAGGGEPGGVEGGVPGGVVGGVPGGVVGGVLGGVPKEEPPPPPPDKPVRVGGQIKAPRKVRDQAPAYPDVAKQARVEGVVVLEAVISPQGRVTEVKVLRGSPLLDDAAVSAVKNWAYTPTLLNGVPVPVVMTVTVSFKLS
ncbi:MAG TPA: TonB family protein [Vicinamibacteria bacterium]|jgi:protein TonB